MKVKLCYIVEGVVVMIGIWIEICEGVSGDSVDNDFDLMKLLCNVVIDVFGFE